MTNSKGGTSTKVGNSLVKLAGIKKNYRDPIGEDPVTRGESTFSVGTSDTYAYVEQEPSSADWLRELVPTGQQVVQYFTNLFPFLRWITRYNLQWLIGITVGAVVVPQSMAYAKLAELKPQFGLYSSFMGVLIYWFFATSKDITIGPVAVMSTLVGQVVIKVQANNPEIPAHYVASALAIICGGIITFIGLIRCGWIVDFIPLTAITAFMTGSAISIAAGQVPSMMGIRGFDTRDATFRVIINTLKHLPDTKIDAAMGLTALFLLYLIRWACNFSARKNPNKQKLFFFLATLRTAFVILLYVMISWLVNKNHREKPIFRILGTVPRGFKNAAVPTVNTKIIKNFASDIPAAVIVLLIEHIAISKSFGRINNYTIDPSQELVAIGVTNLLGPFLGGYPATGSFSRTAIKSKAGVRTPFAGVITAVVVLLAIYALPAVFFYIPNSSLSAVIIHAVGDLITPPNTIYQFWRVSPLEVVIFFAGVLVTIFSSIENGIYCTVCVSAAILLFRVVKAQGQFLGRVKIHSVIGDHVQGNDGKHGGAFEANSFNPSRANNPSSARNIFLPLNHNDGSNPEIEVEQPSPGIFIYQFSEGFNYPNANHYLDYLVSTIYKHTRRTNLDSYPRLGDRPWCDPGPRKGQVEEDRSHLPTLKAIILDFSSVNNVDVTSIQNLIDVRNQLDRYAAPQPVHWHFAHINNRWTKRALVSAGFGYPTPSPGGNGRWKAIFSVAELGGSNSAAAHEALKRRRESDQYSDKFKQDVEAATQAIGHISHKAGGEDGVEETSSTESGNELGKELDSSKVYSVASRRIVAVHGLNRPLFHMDLTSALQGALANSEATAAENNIIRN
ncbi:sulfate permease [Histoplasma capsulatum]|uniref:Sulfate permease n=1 Tax=Ajellomyces capsulatus TaxID=5037 RepID=A0A8A1M9Y0_AJECA|nr:sulfate permease [Histoplasma capsulatum]